MDVKAAAMGAGQLAEGRYAFDNDSVHSTEQHRCLAAAYDPLSTARLAATGVSDGWRCLEVGAGGGSVAHWLAERVAPSGSVLATDVKPGHIAPVHGLTVSEHDIVRDPLPRDEFDLIHARLVLLHLPERQAVLRRLVRALKPGGWLQLDEFDVSYGPLLTTTSDPAAHELYRRFLAAKAAVLERAGADVAWGRRVATAMHLAGLVDIDPLPQLDLWRAGSPGLQLLVHHTHHLRDALVAEGMTDRQLAEVRELLAEPSFLACSCVIYSVHGRRADDGC
ncbi:MAG: class I SAM-dependent methyltransferase [Sciscionella sp.]